LRLRWRRKALRRERLLHRNRIKNRGRRVEKKRISIKMHGLNKVKRNQRLFHELYKSLLIVNLNLFIVVLSLVSLAIVFRF
jgi:hypothetical protein